MSCRKDTKVESEPNDYSMEPPELTDSESEEESEEEDDMMKSYRPSSFLASRSAFIDTETLDTSTDSSDEDTQELQINKDMSKNKLHMNKIKHLHHPPGRALLKTEDQQQTILDKETGDITPRKKRISNTYLRSDRSGQSEDIFNSDRKPE